MGLFFTLLYILTAYLTPPVLFGPLGEYRVEIVLAVPTIIFSLLALRNESRVGSMVQTWASFGFMLAVFLSVLATGWLSSAPRALADFLPNLLVFFFVVLNCRKKIHLQLLIGTLFFIVAFVIVQSQLAEKTAVFLASGNVKDTYYIFMKSDSGETFFRIQGLGVIGDPNDFGQFMTGVLPCLFFFWAKGRSVLNLLRVYLPAGIILWGIYLTHSRGAMLALAVMAIVAFRRRLGLIPSAIGGACMLAGLIAAGFTGGRDVSASAGEDRMEAWSTGLQLLRSHPLFGVGYYHFTDYYYITAHNTIVVCAAEVGIFGFFFWVLFTFTSVRDSFVLGEWGRKQEKARKQAFAANSGPYALNRSSTPSLPGLAFAGPSFAAPSLHATVLDRPSSAGLIRPGAPAAIPAQATEAALEAPAGPPRFGKTKPSVALPPEEIRRMAGLVLLSFVGLLTTGWFLSRAFAMVFFIYGGIAEVVFRMAQERGMEVAPLSLPRAMKLTIAPVFILVAIVYVILRVDNLFPK